MELVVLDTPEAIAERAADAIEELLASKPDAVLGTATGSSPLPLYDELVRRCAAGRLSFARVTGFMLDEYVGLPDEHPERYATFMERNLRSRVDMRPGALHGPDALSEDLEAACRDYEAQMAQAGYCDLQILGIGSDGHIGFNEPADAFTRITHKVALKESTIAANARFFTSQDEVPREAMSMGIGTIFRARHIVLLASGAEKAEAVRDAVKGAITPRVPASILQLHPSVTLIVDQEAGSLLKAEKSDS